MAIQLFVHNESDEFDEQKFQSEHIFDLSKTTKA